MAIVVFVVVVNDTIRIKRLLNEWKEKVSMV